MRPPLNGLKIPLFFCALVGLAVFLAELSIMLFLSPPFRQLVTDVPLLKLIWQTGFLALAYLVASGFGGYLILLGLIAAFGRKHRDPTRWGLWSVRLFTGILFFLYAWWAWRREIFPKNGFMLVLIILGSEALPFLIRPSFAKQVARGKACLVLYGLIFVLEIACRLGGIFFTRETGGSQTVPNVLILAVDTLRSDRLSCYGYKKIQTPAIDRLAEEGCLFEQALSQIPITTPSFASIMTGLYPHTHGIRQNGIPLRENAVTLAEVLQEKGYLTAAFVSGYPLKRRLSGLHQGFGLYQDRFSFFEGFKLLRPFERYARIGLQLERRAADVDELFLPWLKRHPQRPFFVWIHYYDAHTPYHPPLPLAEKTASLKRTLASQDQTLYGASEKEIDPERLRNMMSLYDREIVYADRSIGRILSFLDQSGLREKTLIIFVSDHGESFEHDYLFDHVDQIYDTTVHIPLIFRYPSLIPPGKRYQGQVQTIDLFPTLLSLLNIPSVSPTEGRAINVLEDRGPGPFAYSENLLRADPRPNRKPLNGIRTPEWKYILSPSDHQEELYDLQKDPGETTNVAARYPEEVRTLRAALSEWKARDSHRESPPSLSDEQRDILKSLGYLQ